MTFSRNFVRIVKDAVIAEHASLKFREWTPVFGRRVRVKGQSRHTFLLIASSLMTEGPLVIFRIDSGKLVCVSTVLTSGLKTTKV